MKKNMCMCKQVNKEQDQYGINKKKSKTFYIRQPPPLPAPVTLHILLTRLTDLDGWEVFAKASAVKEKNIQMAGKSGTKELTCLNLHQ